MKFYPTLSQEAVIRAAIAEGRISSPEDALMEAIALWVERERARALEQPPREA